MSEVTKYEPQDPDELRRMAVEYAESGMFRDALKAEQALVKIYAGAELGLNPFQSMSGVHIIQGKAVIGGGLLAVALDKDKEYDYEVEWEGEPGSETACIITVTKNGKTRGKSRFSLQDAERAGLTKKNANYQAYPPNMLFNRAMSNAVRWYAPGVTSIPVYVEGEDGVADEIPRDVPEDVIVKPRTRVTAEVIPDPQRDSDEERVEDAEVELDYEPVTMPPVGKQLRTLGAMERTDLYRLCGVTSKLTSDDAHALFTAKADELGLPFSDPPNINAILSRARLMELANLPDDSSDAFQHFADTGQDLSEDPQVRIS